MAAGQGEDSQDDCPSDGGCDQTFVCSCNAPVLIHPTPGRSVLATAPNRLAVPLPADRVFGSGHLNKLVRPPRSMTGS